MSNWLTHWASVLLLHQIALDRYPDHSCEDSSLTNQSQLLADVKASADCILDTVSFAFGKLYSKGSMNSCISHEDAS